MNPTEEVMQNRIRRALVSVFDKEGVVELCQTLARLEIEILSSGGTARLLSENGVPVTRVADYTGFPEMLDGRVKTLHPRIHAGILAVRSNPAHMADLEKHEIGPLDLVVVNLYPFEETVARPGAGRAEVVEMIDIGGPTLVRAAAKNHDHVGVVVSPADYGRVAAEIEADGGLSDATRLELAARAFGHTARYDTAVCGYLSQAAAPEEPAEASPFGDRLRIDYVKAQELRYGENPHQRAAFYRDPEAGAPSVANAKQLQGKELSFNNILDFDAALATAVEFSQTACAIIKHGNPCGAALGADPAEAFSRALECDPLSAFGGVIAFNRPLDGATAQAVAEIFFEGVIAPAFDDEARKALKRKKKLRLLETGDLSRYVDGGFDLRRVRGGLLAQEWDRVEERVRESRVVTERQPTEEEWRALEFAWKVARHVKSNAIVYTSADRTLGVGAGQMSRVDSARLGVQKAQSPLEGAAMASDAFFPFRDGLDVPAEAGIRAVIQPGGSIRDAEVIEAANEHGMTMVLTGRRHFRH
jgi:phosphoribosylaminoimidazolecarboxamide formyltransferase/IMP cyclohydrolase